MEQYRKTLGKVVLTCNDYWDKTKNYDILCLVEDKDTIVDLDDLKLAEMERRKVEEAAKAVNDAIGKKEECHCDG